MALVIADRVQETTTTTGTGTVTLAGAVSGYQSFAAIGNGNTTYYTITSGSAWEVGIGTYTSAGTTLARTTILASSASGAAITLSGTSNVFSSYPAERAVMTDVAQTLSNKKIQAYSEATTSASSSTAYTVDLSTANIFTISMTGNCTFTFSNPPASGTSFSFMLILTQDATGSRTATWPASVKWPNGSTPTLTTTANKVDILNFITVNGGTTYYGALSLANM
jgi:hypothetical protein